MIWLRLWDVAWRLGALVAVGAAVFMLVVIFRGGGTVALWLPCLIALVGLVPGVAWAFFGPDEVEEEDE